MKKIVLPLLSIALIATACDSSKSVSNNYYDDGIYYNPDKDAPQYAAANTDATIKSSESFSLNDLEENQPTTTNPDANGDLNYYEPNGDEYYDPNANYSAGATGSTVVNNYYNSPSMVSPGFNMGVGWNSWGGWGMSVGYGWGWGGGYYGGWYDPFWSYPWYSPYGCYGYYNPYWGGYGYGGYYGYNSYWNGFYNGYYYGSGGDYGYGGRNVVYVRNGQNSYRGNTYNNVVRSKSAEATRKSSSTGSNRITTNPNRTDIRNTSRTSTRDAVASTRFSDRNINNARLENRTTASVSNASLSESARSGYRSNASRYVEERATTTRSERLPVTSENIRNSRTQTTTNSRTSQARGNWDRTPASSNSGTVNRSNTNVRTAPSRSSNQDIYVPSEQRSRSYQQQQSTQQRTPSYSTPSRSTTPSRSNNTYTPSRSSTPSYSTPSRSSGSSRSYTPSSSSPSRSYSSPSRSSGGSSRGGSRR